MLGQTLGRRNAAPVQGTRARLGPWSLPLPWGIGGAVVPPAPDRARGHMRTRGPPRPRRGSGGGSGYPKLPAGNVPGTFQRVSSTPTPPPTPLAGKVPAQVLQRLMRHSNISLTMAYYANVDDAAMEAVLGGKRSSSR